MNRLKCGINGLAKRLETRNWLFF